MRHFWLWIPAASTQCSLFIARARAPKPSNTCYVVKKFRARCQKIKCYSFVFCFIVSFLCLHAGTLSWNDDDDQHEIDGIECAFVSYSLSRVINSIHWLEASQIPLYRNEIECNDRRGEKSHGTTKNKMTCHTISSPSQNARLEIYILFSILSFRISAIGFYLSIVLVFLVSIRFALGSAVLY